MHRVLFTVLSGLGGLLAVGTIVVLAGGGDRALGLRASTQTRNAKALQAYGRLPLRFEANQGQTDPRVRFVARTPGSTVFLTATGATLALSSLSPGGHSSPHGLPAQRSASAAVSLHVVGADRKASVSGAGRLAGVTNYLTGSDRSRWRTSVPGYGRVSYRSVYPGIDISFYGRQRQLEYDFHVAPGADVGRIGLSLTGGRNIRVDRSGDLVLDTAVGPVRQRAPVIYQQVAGRRRAVSGGYVLTGHGRVGFRVGSYDKTRALVIDPVLAYGTYLGGSLGSEGVTAIGVDQSCSSSCAAYVTGQTSSDDFPLRNAFQGSRGGTGNDTDAFVAKINGDGSALEYSTFLGGSAGDGGSGVAVDSSGRAFVTGVTASAGGPSPAKSFPTTGGAFQGTQGGSDDAFLTVLKPDGSGLDYSTFLGGPAGDSGAGVAVRNGKAFVTGSTGSAAFPTTTGAFDRICDTAAAPCASGDAFVAEVDPSVAGASSLVYSSFLGGGAAEGGAGIAVDSTGAAYVTGSTSSTDFPATAGALQTALSGGGDAFVAKVQTNGTALSYATYLSGSSGASASGIAVDPACASSCSADVTGSTSSTDFPTTPGAFKTTAPGGGDAFVSQLKSDATSLEYSTYLGSSGYDQSNAIAVRAGKAYVTGIMLGSTADFPTKDPIQRPLGSSGDVDAFLSAFDTGASGAGSLVYSTRMGGDGFDDGQGIAADGSGSAYVGGVTQPGHGNFPTTPGVLQPHYAVGKGSQDGFVAKVSPVNGALPYVTGVSPLSGSVAGGDSVRITGRGFGGTSAVQFGSTPAASFTVDSSGQITAISPSHALGAVPVTVTTPAGTSPANPINVFSYGQGRFRPTDNPSTPGIKPVVLKDGRVLLFSPRQFSGPAASAQLYDPKSETWTSTAAPTNLPAYRPDIRSLPYTATLLDNGKVLVTAGQSSGTLADSAELYDPAGGGSWTDTAGQPSIKRREASATRLDGPACRSVSPPSYCGNVLVAGGKDEAGATGTLAELYNPKTDSFKVTAASMKTGHRQHGAVLLDDGACHGAAPPTYCGKVLIAGGFDTFGVPITSAELYDPATDSWSDAAPFKQARARNNLVQLADGRVLEAGGQDIAGHRVEDAELYDPASNTWNLTNTFPSNYPTIPTLLPDGRVLMIEAAGNTLSSGEPAYLFDPTLRGGNGDWVFAGLKPLHANTAGAVLLSSDPLALDADLRTFKGDPAACDSNCGKALVVGADLGAGSPPVLASAELFTPEPRPAGGGGGGTGTGPSSGLISTGTTGGGSDTTAPGVSDFGLSNNPFVVAGAKTPTFGSAAAKKKRHKKGTTFRYTLSEAASARIVISQRSSGRRKGKGCVAPTRKLRKAKRCTRVIVRGTLTRTSHQGKNSVAFSGRIGPRKLSPGRYQATLTATDAARNTSKPKMISFTIVKR